MKMKLAVALFALMQPPAIDAQDYFAIKQASTELQQSIYYLNTNASFEFSDQVLQALHSGIPITLVVQIHIRRQRQYWWDATVNRLKHRFEIRYQALTKQYQLRNMLGEVKNFGALFELQNHLGRLSFPLMDRYAVPPGARHYVQWRVKLDLESLPVPLRLKAYTSNAWNLSTPWHRCEL